MFDSELPGSPGDLVFFTNINNVVNFVWPPVHQKIELETLSKILPLRRGLSSFIKNLSVNDFSRWLKFVINVVIPTFFLKVV